MSRNSIWKLSDECAKNQLIATFDRFDVKYSLLLGRMLVLYTVNLTETVMPSNKLIHRTLYTSDEQEMNGKYSHEQGVVSMEEGGNAVFHGIHWQLHSPFME